MYGFIYVLALQCFKSTTPGLIKDKIYHNMKSSQTICQNVNWFHALRTVLGNEIIKPTQFIRLQFLTN